MLQEKREPRKWGWLDKETKLQHQSQRNNQIRASIRFTPSRLVPCPSGVFRRKAQASKRERLQEAAQPEAQPARDQPGHTGCEDAVSETRSPSAQPSGQHCSQTPVPRRLAQAGHHLVSMKSLRMVREKVSSPEEQEQGDTSFYRVSQMQAPVLQAPGLRPQEKGTS